MPRAILVFRLPQERAEHELAIGAGDIAASLTDVARVLRDREKHGGPMTKAERKLFDQVRGAIDYPALDRAGFW